MRNIRLLVEYDGTGYAGWQLQPDLPTIQGALTSAVKSLTGEDVQVKGASRTDAGVHAYGQVASFTTACSIPERGILMGLNSMLPPGISVKEAVEADQGFDPRLHSKGKTYVYRVINRDYRSGLLARYSWFVCKPLDIGRMREASLHLIGEKDFASFMAADSDARHSVREVTSIMIEEKEGGMIEFTVTGTAFLRHMVRIMVGTLVAAGKGTFAPGHMEKIVEAKNRAAASMTAPAKGLFLVKVDY